MLSVDSCPVRCNLMDHRPPGSSVPGILQARILEWVAIISSRGTSWPRDWTHTSSVWWLSHVWLFATPWTAARQASLSIANYQSLLKLMSMKLVMPSNHLILCRPLFLPSSIFPSLRVFSNELVLCTRWPKYWSFSFSISPANGYSGLIPLGWTGWISLQSKGLSRVFSNITVQKHQFFCTKLSS